MPFGGHNQLQTRLLSRVRAVFPDAIVIVGQDYFSGMSTPGGFTLAVYNSEYWNVPPDGASPLLVVFGETEEQAEERFLRCLEVLGV